MSQGNCIVSYCSIRNNQVRLNGKLIFEDSPETELSAFLGKLYRHMELSYPKFFKMDRLCKLGLLATELVLQNGEMGQKDKTALVFSNRSSSLDSDRQHQQTINDKENYFPSPSVFVYTLPNILLGEIAIKYKLTGENAFFVSPSFDPQLLCSYTDLLVKDTLTESVICGWADVDGNENEAFVYWVKKPNFNLEKKELCHTHDALTTQQLYSSNGSTGNNQEP